MSAAPSPTWCWRIPRPARTVIHKVSTTPADPSRRRGGGDPRRSARIAGVAAGAVGHVLHGTTIATNAVLEHRGRGMRHDHQRAASATSIHIGRHQRPSTTRSCRNIPWQAAPLVKRRHRKRWRSAWSRRPARSWCRWTRRRCASAALALKAGGRRLHRHLLPVLLPQPRARAARAGDRAGGDAGRLRHHLLRRRAAVPRVRALHHRGDERLHRPEGARLRRAARGRHAARRGSTADLHIMALERRRRHGRRWWPSSPSLTCCPAPPPACWAAPGSARWRAATA